MTSRLHRVFVTGMGACTSLGSSVQHLWDGLLAGRSGVVALTQPDLQGLRSQIGAPVAGFEPSKLLDPKEQRRASRASQLALVAADEAIRHARLREANIDPKEVAVIIGSSIGGFTASDSSFRDFYTHGRVSPLTIPISMNSGPSSWVSIKFGYEGAVMNVDAACASGAHSLAHAWSMIRCGMQDVAITGGADTPFARGVMEAWCAMRALSTRNDSPATACRPFSVDRDGLVLGEGAGILVLESEESARRRGVEILAEICGYGATSDAYHLTQPTWEGPARAMSKALRSAGMHPEDIDCVNAHATSTPRGDINETRAIKDVFGMRSKSLPIVANKAALGHSVAATGAIELISSILSLRHQMLPKTINFTERDPECDLDYVTDGPRSLPLRAIVSNSFAFGGSNASLVVRRAEL